jgi:hypothetical protein
MVHDSLEAINRPPKLMKLDDGRGSSFSAGSLNVSNTTGSGLSKVFGVSSLPVNLVPKAEAQYSEKQISQVRSPCWHMSIVHNPYISLSDQVVFHAFAGLFSQLETVVSNFFLFSVGLMYINI